MNTLLLCALPCIPLWAADAPSASHDTEAELRARAWTTILQIRDESVRTIHWRERITSHLPDGTSGDLARYEAWADDLHNLRVHGEMCMLTAWEPRTIECHALIFSLTDGVMRAVNVERNVGIVRTQQHDLVVPWCSAGAWTGLGRTVNLNQLRTRADHLRECPDLTVEQDGPDGRVVLTGIDRLDHRLFRHRVEIDPRTGDVLRHQVIDLTWETLFVDWIMPEWTVVDDVRVPIRVEYRVYLPEIDPATQETLREARAAAGLTSAAMAYDSPDYAEWVRIRKRILGNGPIPVRIAAAPQTTDVEVFAVNRAMTSADFALPAHGALRAILSDALECEVDAMELEPSSASKPTGY